MQTILGAGGVIGTELAKALTAYTKEIRLVSRNPRKVNPGDELFPADLLDASSLEKAVEGSEVVYVTVGFKYDLRVWRKNWPLLIDNVLNACMKNKCKLVFFDNIYMYDPAYLNGMNEETPVKPVSKKGEVRAAVYERILEEIKEGRVTALVARAADFYGPGIKQVSMLTETVFSPLSQGKKANWMGSVNYKHSFTYTPDAGKATALLGNTADAFGQVWHLPTAANPYTGKEWIEKIAGALGVAPGYKTTSKSALKMAGVFVPILRELAEMQYQYEQDYVFDSSKFEKHFDFKPTSYDDGIREIISSDYKKK